MALKNNIFSKITPIASVKGIDIPLDPTVRLFYLFYLLRFCIEFSCRGWNLNSLQAEASKWEKSVSDYLAANFTPPPPPPAEEAKPGAQKTN